MEEKLEAEYLMRELIKRLKTQKAVAAKLGQTPQAFNYSLHHAQTVPLKRIIKMRMLLNELLVKERTATLVPTPLIEDAHIKLELSTSERKEILANFRAVQAFLFANYNNRFSLKMINTEVYSDLILLEAEKHTQLPLRTAFMGLLACCDKSGQFYWEPEHLNAMIFPYVPINFRQLLDVLCTYRFVEKKQIASRLFGYIPLKNKFVYEVQPKKKHKNVREII